MVEFPRHAFPWLLVFALMPVSALPAQDAVGAYPLDAHARRILAETGVRGGLVVHLGCGSGELTAALRVNESYLVHGLDIDPENVREARKLIRERGLYGVVSVDRLRGRRLPYIDGLVNLVIARGPSADLMREILRVLAPRGVAYVQEGDRWTKTVKPWPDELDEWTHYMHGPSNNAVSQDTVVAPPRRLQWTGGPAFTRHHDRMSSVSGAVSARGRVFYIIDEASRVSILTPPEWMVVARDAFNGTILWKRRMGKWHTHLWPLKSGPAQLPRRLVADGDRVYLTLSLDGPVTALDGATGKTAHTYAGTAGTEEILLSEGTLLALVNENAEEPAYADRKRIDKAYGAKFWDESPRKVVAVRVATGEMLWDVESRVLPGTLAADAERVVFHDGQSVVSLDHRSGDEVWRSDPIARAGEIKSFYVPTLVLYQDIVLFSGGETAGMQTGSWYLKGEDTMTALSARTGKRLWSAYHPPSGYRSPEDLFVASGLVWSGETTSGRAKGVFTGRDPHTGEVKSQFPPDVDPYWFHHRCFRGKATEKYLLVSRTGTEFIDVNKKTWIPHHWFRGACSYGILPANGLVYAPPHPCACYLEAKLYGFNALAPPVEQTSAQPAARRLEKGPVYGVVRPPKTGADEWPTYRHDAARSGMTSVPVSPAVKPVWRTGVGGKVTSPVVAEGKVFLASVDAHTVHALDAKAGRELWRYTVGGRVDSPPTYHEGFLLFGSADGHVYCLRAEDGLLAWRFRAAPADRRLVSYGQLESVWPVHGSVLVEQGVLYCVAGRSMFLDGGLHLFRLDPATGRELSTTLLSNVDPKTGEDLHSYVSWLNMPTTLPDILSSDGRLIYMRSQPFRLDGKRLEIKKFPSGGDADAGAPDAVQKQEHAHLFCPTGFLDDSWWHRSYWMFGSMYVSGWQGYYRAGKTAPSGRILSFDDSRVYAFGRKPQYFRWTTPIEHQLFAASRVLPGGVEGR